MTAEDLRKGNELLERIDEISRNIHIMNDALSRATMNGKIKKFSLFCRKKNEIRIEGEFIAFADSLKVDRECMELIRSYFVTKREDLIKEFENIGKGGE